MKFICKKSVGFVMWCIHIV